MKGKGFLNTDILYYAFYVLNIHIRHLSDCCTTMAQEEPVRGYNLLPMTDRFCCIPTGKCPMSFSLCLILLSPLSIKHEWHTTCKNIWRKGWISTKMILRRHKEKKGWHCCKEKRLVTKAAKKKVQTMREDYKNVSNRHPLIHINIKERKRKQSDF